MDMYWNGYVLIATVLVIYINTVTCTPDFLYYRLREEQNSGFYIGNILTDSSLANNYSSDILRILEFKFLTKGKVKDLFTLDRKTGILKTKEKIDREKLCALKKECDVKLDIAVQPSAYFKVIKVEITLEDVNDYSPMFMEAEIHHIVSENTSPGVLFPIIPAKDLDSPKYSIQSYELKRDTSKKFGLQITKIDENSFDLNLMLKGSLDREERDHYTLELVAYDGGDPPRIGAQLLQIKIRDVNDNAPEFKQNAQELNVLENIPVGSTIVVVSAHDEDSGPNGKITYSLDRGSNRKYGEIFEVDPNNGTLRLLSSLDYETQTLYSLKILAQDEGAVSLTSSAVVTIHVIDVNDNYPEVLVNSISRTVSGAVFVSVTEHDPANSYVALITVKDSDEHENGHTECRMQEEGGKSYFRFIQLMQNEYKLTTLHSLDREKKPQHFIKIICSDHGVPTRTSIVTVTVSVNDINDNTPVFTKDEYIYSLLENNQVNDSIGYVKAHDLDRGENSSISYHFCNANDSSLKEMVYLDEVTGSIKAKMIFDREASDRFQFCARAVDHGPTPKSSEAKVFVYIGDQDDESPHFKQKTFEFSVAENKPVGSFVGRLMAYDNDAPPNDEFSFLLTDLNVDKYFRIDLKSGAIYTKTLLDRERNDKFYLNVSVVSPSYQLNSDNAFVKIKVEDANDNAPIIKFPRQNSNTNLQISNKVPVGYNITKIKATDADLHENAVLTYSFVARVPFVKIDADTGVISVADDISKFEIKQINIPIKVTDNGKSPLHDTGGFSLTINSSIPYVPAMSKLQENGNFWGQNLKIFIIAIATAVIAVFFIVMFAVLCVAYKKSGRKNGKKYWLAAGEGANVKTAKGEMQNGEKDVKMAEGNGIGVCMDEVPQTMISSMESSQDTLEEKMAMSRDSQEEVEPLPPPPPPPSQMSSPPNNVTLPYGSMTTFHTIREEEEPPGCDNYGPFEASPDQLIHNSPVSYYNTVPRNLGAHDPRSVRHVTFGTPRMQSTLPRPNCNGGTFI